MKRPTGLLVFLTVLIAFALSFHARTNANSSLPEGPRRPVVVELFTSEGCSSCPPADRFLAKLGSDQPIPNVEVIALEQHVDYWNNLGWTDPFSSEFSTLRQYAYAGALGNGNAYTPQMVVDGQNEFVGSRERQAQQAIKQAAITQKADVSVTPSEQRAGDSPRFRISVGKLVNAVTKDTPEVWMAITETGLHSEVKRGENAGEDLHHAAVVRAMRRIGTAKDNGEISFFSEEVVKLDRSWKRENLRFVIIVQEKTSRRILGAGTASFAQ